jgi:hypothetical protein
MKKIVVAIAILLANGAFVSCTDLDDNLENNSDNLEILSTGGEEEHDPEEEEDPNNGG